MWLLRGLPQLMFNVLGRSIGLDVQGLDVPISAYGQTVDNTGHLACMIHLVDGRAAIVDGDTRSSAGGASVSRPFEFTKTYHAKGSYWELNKDARNSSGLHLLRSATWITPVLLPNFLAFEQNSGGPRAI